MNYPQGKQLKGYSRGKTPINQIVLHESVTNTREACITVLANRSLSIHFSVDRDGSVEQHLPVEKAGAHAEGFGKPSLHNECSISVEIINRYYGEYAKPDQEVISTVWAHKSKYIVPTQPQCESVWVLVQNLCSDYQIPFVFPGVSRKLFVGPEQFNWGRITKHEVPGIMAHHRWAHADALFPEHYCVLRSRGLNPTDAFAQTKLAAASGQRATTLPKAIKDSVA